MFGLHWGYIVLILVVVLIVFGPGRLPELGGAVGKALREFRRTTSEITNEVTQAAVPAKPEEASTDKPSTSETKPSSN